MPTLDGKQPMLCSSIVPKAEHAVSNVVSTIPLRREPIASFAEVPTDEIGDQSFVAHVFRDQHFNSVRRFKRNLRVD